MLGNFQRGGSSGLGHGTPVANSHTVLDEGLVGVWTRVKNGGGEEKTADSCGILTAFSVKK